MGRGKKTSYDEIVNIFVSFAATGSVTQTAKDLDIPRKTVEGIIKKHRDEEEFAEILLKNKKEFSERAKAVRDKGLYLMEKRLNRAIKSEGELDMLIDEIDSDADIKEPLKASLIAKIKTLQIQSIKDLTVAVGTLYDKIALAEGKSTEINEINIRLSDEEQ